MSENLKSFHSGCCLQFIHFGFVQVLKIKVKCYKTLKTIWRFMKNLFLIFILFFTSGPSFADTSNRWEYRAGLIFYNHEYYRTLTSHFKSQTDANQECKIKLNEAKQKLIAAGLTITSAECSNKIDGHVMEDTLEGGFLAATINFEGNIKDACKALDSNGPLCRP